MSAGWTLGQELFLPAVMNFFLGHHEFSSQSCMDAALIQVLGKTRTLMQANAQTM